MFATQRIQHLKNATSNTTDVEQESCSAIWHQAKVVRTHQNKKPHQDKKPCMQPGLAPLEHPPEIDTKLHIALIPVAFALVGANTDTTSYRSTTLRLPAFYVGGFPVSDFRAGFSVKVTISQCQDNTGRCTWIRTGTLSSNDDFTRRSSSAVSRCVPFAPPPHSGSFRCLFFDPLRPTAVKDFDGWILAGLQDGVSAPCSALVDQVDYHPHRQAPRGPQLHGTTTPFFILVHCTITTRKVNRTTMKRAAQMILGGSLRFHLVPMIS